MGFGKSKSGSEQTFDPELKASLLNVFLVKGSRWLRHPTPPHALMPRLHLCLQPSWLVCKQLQTQLKGFGVGQTEVNNAINTANRLTNATPSTVNPGSTAGFVYSESNYRTKC